MEKRINDIINILKIKKEEVIPIILLVLFFATFHFLFIYHYKTDILYQTHGSNDYFFKTVSVSGFDAYVYSILTDWNMAYDVYRHPLFAYFLYPLYWLNRILIYLTGVNCCQYITAIALLVSTIYSYIFSYRLFREIIGLSQFESNLLSFMLFSFAYVMIAVIFPDHFGFTLPFLICSAYYSGKNIKNGKLNNILCSFFLFTITAGITVTNGIKVFLYSLLTNKRKFFQMRYFILGVLLPIILLLCSAILSDNLKEKQIRTEVLKKDKELRKILYSQISDTIINKEKSHIQLVYKQELRKRIQAKYIRDHIQKNKYIRKPVVQGRFWGWTDMSVSKWESFYENFLGESIQLHSKFLLIDIYKGRPVIVRYDHFYNYFVEILLLLLFVMGIWFGRHSSIMWMCLLSIMFDIFLHIIVGFGINEVFIMTTHWAFVLPITISFCLASSKGLKRQMLRIILTGLVFFFYLYNGNLLLQFLNTPK